MTFLGNQLSKKFSLLLIMGYLDIVKKVFVTVKMAILENHNCVSDYLK